MAKQLNQSLMPQDSHIIDWLHAIDPENMTLLMLQKCSRDELFALLYLSTGLSPLDRLPSLDKDECISSLQAEYHRLQRPVAQLKYDGPRAREHVAQLLGQQQLPASEAAQQPESQESLNIVFIGGQWVLQQLDAEGNPTSQATLPDINPDGQGFWQVVADADGNQIATQESEDTLLISDIFGPGEAAAGSGGALAPGVSAKASMLPGMTGGVRGKDTDMYPSNFVSPAVFSGAPADNTTDMPLRLPGTDSEEEVQLGGPQGVVIQA